MENWQTSTVKDRESALILRRYVVHGTFFELLYCNEYSYGLEAGVSDNLCSFLKKVKPLVLYSVEHGIAMEQMKGKWASSRVDLGYTELFCIPELHQCSSRFVTVFLGLSGVPARKSRLLTCLIGNTGLLCMQCREIEPHFPARGMSHTISQVAAGTWGIFASYSGDGHSKLHFVQRSQE